MSASTKLPFEAGFAGAGEVPARAPSLLARLRGRVNELFPERQILIRGPGNIAALRASQRMQVIFVVAAMLVLLGLAVSTAGLFVAWRVEAQVARRAAALQLALAAAQSEAAAESQAFAQAARDRDLAVARANAARDEAILRADQARDIAIAQARQARDLAVARANAVLASDKAALNDLIRRTESTMGQVEGVIKSTGLDPDHLAAGAAAPPRALRDPAALAGAAAPGAAGPSAPSAAGRSAAGVTGLGAPGADGPMAALPDDTARHADLLLAELARLQALGAVLAQLPLSSPTAQAVVSSGFGLRADPFTGAPEFHVGIDLPGPIGAPVYATAPGKVTFAGPSTGYGNLVTIDHGYGLSTRYSHLDKILVKVGAAVALHQEIGLMGNTGWSTGPHLLYETRVDGQPQNPLNFIKVNPYDVQN